MIREATIEGIRYRFEIGDRYPIFRICLDVRHRPCLITGSVENTQFKNILLFDLVIFTLGLPIITAGTFYVNLEEKETDPNG